MPPKMIIFPRHLVKKIVLKRISYASPYELSRILNMFFETNSICLENTDESDGETSYEIFIQPDEVQQLLMSVPE